jgi:hypothetical protein
MDIPVERDEGALMLPQELGSYHGRITLAAQLEGDSAGAQAAVAANLAVRQAVDYADAVLIGIVRIARREANVHSGAKSGHIDISYR